jgi:hypothetical protein
VCVSVCQCVSVCVYVVTGKLVCFAFRKYFFYLVRDILMLGHKGLSFSLSKLVCGI